MTHLSEPPRDLLDGAALFLDFDGTLVELAETPSAISVPPLLVPLLLGLRERLGGRLALVSGRALADLDLYLPNIGLAASGSHGLEMRDAGGAAQAMTRLPALEGACNEAKRFAALHPGLLVETKPAGLAIHYRQAPETGPLVDAFVTRLAQRSGAVVQRGAMVAEMRAKGHDKGDAIAAFMTRAPFRGARPIFLGDDLTDEHAFLAAGRLGGAGVLVGPERATAARFRLPSVAAAASWLEAAL